MKKEIHKKVLGNSKSVDDLSKKTGSIKLREKNTESKRSGKTHPQRKQKKRFIVSELPDCWVAHDIDDHLSGFLLYDKKTGQYHASLSEFRLYYGQLAKGGYNNPEDCPVYKSDLDKSHIPKGELLLMIALRERYKKHTRNDQYMKYVWRTLAIKQILNEIEKSTGKSTSEKNLKIWLDIARDDMEFEKKIGEWLVARIQDKDAGNFLMRLGNWINRIDFIETFTIAADDEKFFTSVALAAKKAGCIPTQKDVRYFFEKQYPTDTASSGTKFRSIMKNLYFDWLPAGGRGKNTHQKYVGFKLKLRTHF